MRLRKRLAFPLAGLLGAAVAILPAVAASEGPTIEAENVGLYYHYWRPPSVSVSPGGAVALSNGTAVKHGVEWTSGPETPSCTNGVPVGTGEAASGTNWSGSCTFAKAGVYTFGCTVHGEAMQATITVGSTGTTTTTTTPTTTTSTTTPAGPPPPGPTGGGAPGSPGTSLSPFAGTTVKLAAALQAKSVRGSVHVSSAGAGGRLEVDLLATRAALASSGAHTPVRVGRLVRFPVYAGLVTFKVRLDSRALHALHARGRLALTVRIALTPPGGAPRALPGQRLVLHR